MKLSEVIKNQATINIGTIGHVAHGKSTLVYDITGVKTQKHSNELERNITIVLGYADFYVYVNKTTKEVSFSNKLLEDNDLVLCKHASFIDCPGHKALMSTMIAGSKVMNAAFLLVSSHEHIPQPQTVSHTDILKHTDISDILILFNKIDLIKKDSELENKIEELAEFVSDYPILEDKPIIPISAFKKLNIEEVGKYVSNLPETNLEEEANKEFVMCVLRSFDINTAGVQIDNLKGGVVGGSIQSGYIRVGDKVIITPGILKKIDDVWVSYPVFSTVLSIYSDKRPLEIAFPGGLIALGLDIDPALCKQNNFLGNKVFKLTKENIDDYTSNQLLATKLKIKVEYIKDSDQFKNASKIQMIINSKTYNGRIEKKEAIERSNNKVYQKMKISLDLPTIVLPNEKYPLLTEIDGTLELFGIAVIRNIIVDVKVNLPQGFEEFTNDLPDNFEKIQIENDIPEIKFNTSKHILENLKENTKKQLVFTKVDKIQYPDIILNKGTMQINWVNFGVFNSIFNDQVILGGNVKFYQLKTILPAYIRYQYGMTDTNCTSATESELIIHIKVKGLKLLPENVINGFFKNFIICKKCKTNMCRLCKIQTQVFHICLLCSHKNIISEPWVKELKIC